MWQNFVLARLRELVLWILGDTNNRWLVISQNYSALKLYFSLNKAFISYHFFVLFFVELSNFTNADKTCATVYNAKNNMRSKGYN